MEKEIFIYAYRVYSACRFAPKLPLGEAGKNRRFLTDEGLGAPIFVLSNIMMQGFPSSDPASPGHLPPGEGFGYPCCPKSISIFLYIMFIWFIQLRTKAPYDEGETLAGRIEAYSRYSNTLMFSPSVFLLRKNPPPSSEGGFGGRCLSLAALS